MAYQSGKNVQIAFKREAFFGTKPGASGGTVFRASPGPGLSLAKASIQSTEFRTDGQSLQVRHGSRSVNGSYTADLSVGTFDALLQAVFRSSWEPPFTITEADVTSITTGANTIIAASGSWLTLGVKVGDVIVLTGHNQASNNNRNLRVTAVTANTITVAESLASSGTADDSFTLKVNKRLVMRDTPEAHSFTFEQILRDLGSSQIYKGCRITGMNLRFQVDAPIEVSFTVIGQDAETTSGGSAPFFVSPSVSTSELLTCVGGKIRVNGVDRVDLTSFELSVELGGATQPVVGSVLTPDVFTNPAVVTGSFSSLKSDITDSGLFLNETVFDVNILCTESSAPNAPFISLYVGNCKAMGAEGNIGDDNALIETLQLNIGKDVRTGQHSSTMVKLATSAPYRYEDDAVNLLIDTLGPDCLAIYDGRLGITLSDGVVSQWDDVRGSGFAPPLTAEDTARPAYDSDTSELVFDGVDDVLETAVDALFGFSATSPKWIAAVLRQPVPPASSNRYHASLYSSMTDFGGIATGVTTPVGSYLNRGSYGGSAYNITSPTIGGPLPRLVIVSIRPNGVGRIGIPDTPITSGTTMPITTVAEASLVLARASTTYARTIIKCAIVGNGSYPNEQQREALRLYALNRGVALT